MTSTFLERRLKASREQRDLEEAEIAPMIQLGPQTDLLANMQRQIASAAREDIEQIPRKTLVKMFQTTPLEEKFVFKTELNGGRNYVQAMRQVLARVRNKAKAEKLELEDFKLFELSVEAKEDYDEVVLVRSAVMTQKEQSVYNELTDIMKIQLRPRK